MSEDPIPFSLPQIGEEEIAEVVQTLRSGWLTTGPKSALFEKEFSSYLGTENCLAINSATSGLHLALCALGIGENDEVIVPVNTFVSTAEVVRYLGAHPRFVDIDARTMNLDIEAVSKLLQSDSKRKIKAIIPVHIAGLACDMKPLFEMCSKSGVEIIEDAAHALPCSYQGQKIGTLESFATVFSFYVTKPLCTGEGGMVCLRDSQAASKVEKLRMHGIDRDVWDRYTNPAGSWQYDVIAAGFKYNFPDLLASIGLHQLRKIDGFAARRAQVALTYHKFFRDSGMELPPQPEAGDTHSWHLYLLRLPPKANRDRFIQEMSSRGIGTSVHFIPLHLMSYYKQRYNYEPEDFPVALKSFQRLVSIPIYSRLNDAQVNRICTAVLDCLRLVSED